MDISFLRTLLFTPGNEPQRFEKAKESGADGVVIDLEDAIALAEKDSTRDLVIKYFKQISPVNNFYYCLRINSIKTQAGIKDIVAILENNIQPDALILPKVEYSDEVKILDELLKNKNISYFATVESALGLHNADAIATSSTNIKSICFGGADLAADLGVNVEWEPLFVARSQIVKSAALAGIIAFDMPYLKVHQTDKTELLNETRKVKSLGYYGKFCIHPEQIQSILEVFTPSPEEVSKAQQIVAAYKQSKGEVCEINGKMIDVPVFRSAERILAKATKNYREDRHV
ncbi:MULTISPECIES: HpcH/HpaI aldolase/citrate lyase family protein [Legionella]|uniref:HpcH/HpaI aldolase/citrate lyase family protein n=1 Tax=Legionella TaxID=445 RepID=UPI000F8E6C6D|nr:MULTISPECIES: CoA ester lyase [Legionella]MCP0913376.1 CoA ester lyase [Legionella sp. 27cVA30]RUQ95163.1 CoA ester lyase [Legionella septentrionalis]RUR08988.1 CoA ester lyase [Legionella septentrionalis]RUR14886.1 CoA ester lyase [Legionella septentrionalis]